jgi:hypothetical protein
MAATIRAMRARSSYATQAGVVENRPSRAAIMRGEEIAILCLASETLP